MLKALPRWFLAAFVCGLVGIGACRGDRATPASYTVRGQIKGMERVDGQPTVDIHHEQIPEFVDHRGHKTGMVSMTMPFGLGAGVTLDGLAVGDKVEVVFSVDRDRNPPTQITSIRKLPGDTPLTLTGI